MAVLYYYNSAVEAYWHISVSISEMSKLRLYGKDPLIFFVYDDVCDTIERIFHAIERVNKNLEYQYRNSIDLMYKQLMSLDVQTLKTFGPKE